MTDEQTKNTDLKATNLSDDQAGISLERLARVMMKMEMALQEFKSLYEEAQLEKAIRRGDVDPYLMPHNKNY